MKKEKIEFSYTVFDDIGHLSPEDAMLVEKARKTTALAYAPYSKFQVGAVALLANGEILHGSNQENASYPVGTCAERVLLGTIANAYPETPIKTMVISFNSQTVNTNEPISPCGMCRQALNEYELRTKSAIRLLFSGQSGKIILLENATCLLPLAFTAHSLAPHT